MTRLFKVEHPFAVIFLRHFVECYRRKGIFATYLIADIIQLKTIFGNLLSTLTSYTSINLEDLERKKYMVLTIIIV